MKNILINNDHKALANIGTNSHSAIDTFIGTTVPATYAPLASPVFTTQITTPLVVGGTGTTSDLTLQTTSGVGATGADMHFLVGNNGATEAMTILNSGNVGIGTTGPAYKLDISETSSASIRIGTNINLAAGYTGSDITAGLLSANYAKSTGFAFNTTSAATPEVNAGVYGISREGGVGVYQAGLAGFAYEAANAIGVVGRGSLNSTAGTAYGVLGYGHVNGTQTAYGGWFGLAITNGGTQNSNSTALVADNMVSTGRIFEARDNGTAVLSIIDGGNVGIGTTSPTNILSLGGNAARKFWMERHTTANTAGNSLTLQGGGATVGATDKNGGDLILGPGLSTGTGLSGVQIQGSPAQASTNTTDNAVTTQIQVLGNKIGFYGVTPVIRPTALTTADASALNTGDATSDTVIANMRTRIGELESKLQGLGLLA